MIDFPLLVMILTVVVSVSFMILTGKGEEQDGEG